MLTVSLIVAPSAAFFTHVATSTKHPLQPAGNGVRTTEWGDVVPSKYGNDGELRCTWEARGLDSVVELPLTACADARLCCGEYRGGPPLPLGSLERNPKSLRLAPTLEEQPPPSHAL